MTSFVCGTDLLLGAPLVYFPDKMRWLVRLERVSATELALFVSSLLFALHTNSQNHFRSISLPIRTRAQECSVGRSAMIVRFLLIARNQVLVAPSNQKPLMHNLGTE